MAFLDDSLVLYQIRNINSVSNLWLFYLQRPAWVSVLDSLGGNLGCSDAVIIRQIPTSGRTGMEPEIQMTLCFLRWASDEMTEAGFRGEGSFILPFTGAGLMASFSGLNPPLVMKVMVSVGGLHPRRFRKSLWTSRIHFSAVGSNLDDTIWFFLMYLPYFWG